MSRLNIVIKEVENGYVISDCNNTARDGKFNTYVAHSHSAVLSVITDLVNLAEDDDNVPIVYTTS